MLLLSECWVGQNEKRQFKAPKGMMYRLHSFHATNFSSVANQLFVLDEGLDEPPTSLGFGRPFLALIDLNIDGLFVYGEFDNHKTKFLSMGPLTIAQINSCIQIYGELVIASRTELLIEWFRKGR